jgi:predicted GNAT family acetyltransferase
VLKLAGARLLGDRDTSAVRVTLDGDPVAACMVSARVEIAGLDPWRLGGEMWGWAGFNGLCFSGANLVPLCGTREAMRAFADRALRRRRACSSVVGPADQVLDLWHELAPTWGPARDIRPDQPLMSLSERPWVRPDPMVRPVRPDELDRYFPAAVAMFTEEVGIDPRTEDGGAAFRARVGDLIAAGRAFARFDGADVVFKCEIGALSRRVGQLQGVWVHPERRGAGLGTAGTAAVADRLIRSLGRVASLYVNGYNVAALRAYHRVGFRQIGQYGTVLF